MAKKKCVKFGRVHGRKVCRKFSGRKKGGRRGGSTKMAVPGLMKSISATGRSSCKSPARAERTNALMRYIQGQAELTISRGVPALGKGRAKSQLSSLHKALRATYRLNTKCVLQARKAAARAAKKQAKYQASGPDLF